MKSSADLATMIEHLLYARIGQVDHAIRMLGYRARIGVETEVYVFGPQARTFLAEGSDALVRLKGEFPLVGRVYAEADIVALRNTPLRLGVPRVRKWEITTRHVGPDGTEISPAHQAKLVTGIQEFMVAEAARTGHIAHYGARPIHDVRDLIGRPGPLRITDQALLASIRRQVYSTRFIEAVRAQCRLRASALTFLQLSQALPDLSATDIRQVVRDLVYRQRDKGVVRLAGRAIGRNVCQRIERERRVWASTAARIRRGIATARSFADLCREPKGLIEPTRVPCCGVDVNLSLVRGGRNAFHDPGALDKASALFHSVARASVACLGRTSGSLLPVAQSYKPETFERLFRVDLDVPDHAGLGAKCTGASCKLSPDSIAANPSRAVEHAFDELGPDTIRLEMRAGEAGGGSGLSNPLASPHTILLMLVAAHCGIATVQKLSVRRFGATAQPLNTSHRDSVASFERSDLLRRGYGARLHGLVAQHAKLLIERAES